MMEYIGIIPLECHGNHKYDKIRYKISGKIGGRFALVCVQGVFFNGGGALNRGHHKGIGRILDKPDNCQYHNYNVIDKTKPIINIFHADFIAGHISHHSGKGAVKYNLYYMKGNTEKHSPNENVVINVGKYIPE